MSGGDLEAKARRTVVAQRNRGSEAECFRPGSGHPAAGVADAPDEDAGLVVDLAAKPVRFALEDLDFVVDALGMHGRGAFAAS